MSSLYAHEDDPGLEGPDYVAIVIEWDEDSEAATLVSAQDALGSSTTHSTARKIATVVGALAALVFATWGIRHLRTS
jgi:hypothetical protein